MKHLVIILALLIWLFGTNYIFNHISAWGAIAWFFTILWLAMWKHKEIVSFINHKKEEK